MPRKKIDIKNKKLHLQFVYLAEEEYASLCALLGKAEADRWIEELNGALGQHGYQYESHYWTIRNWARRAKAKTGSQGPAAGSRGSEAQRALDVVIEALKNPNHKYMPEFTATAAQAARTALARMGLNWPELKRRIGENPGDLAEFRKKFLEAY